MLPKKEKEKKKTCRTFSNEQNISNKYDYEYSKSGNTIMD